AGAYRAGPRLRSRGGRHLRRFPPSRLDEGSQDAWGLPAGREDLRGEGRRHHAHFGIDMTEPPDPRRCHEGRRSGCRRNCEEPVKPAEVRNVLAGWRFRLATLVPTSYTHTFR